MASLAATNWTKPLSLIPCLSWSTASQVFTQGVMSGAIPWETLQEQFFENRIFQDEISKLVTSPEKNGRNAYNMGQQFAKHYPQDLGQMEDRLVETIRSEAELLNVPSHAAVYPSVKSSPKHPSSEPNDSLVNKKHTNNDTMKCATHINSDNLRSSSDLLNEDLEKHSILTNEMRISHQTSTMSFQSTSIRQSSSESHTDLDIDQNSNSQEKPESVSQIIDTRSNEESSRLSRLKQVRQALTLNYARTKQSQQLKTSSSSKSEKKALSLSHAQAKSKLLTSRSNKKVRPTDPEKLKSLQRDSYEFMVGVMDECTHLGNFSVPVDPELIIIVAAKQDAYVPREGVLGLDQLWPGCEVRYIDQGHVGAVILHQAEFRKAIKDSFDRQIKKYYPEHVQKVKSPQYLLWKKKTS